MLVLERAAEPGDRAPESPVLSPGGLLLPHLTRSPSKRCKSVELMLWSKRCVCERERSVRVCVSVSVSGDGNLSWVSGAAAPPSLISDT